MVMHVGNSGGSRAWQGLLGRRPDGGIDPPPVNGCPQGILLRCVNVLSLPSQSGAWFARRGRPAATGSNCGSGRTRLPRSGPGRWRRGDDGTGGTRRWGSWGVRDHSTTSVVI